MILSETVHMVRGVGGRGVHLGLIDVGLNVLTCRAGTIIGDNGI